MTGVPKTYAEWSALLEQFRRHEDDVVLLQAMRQGTLFWQVGVAERFSQLLVDVVNERMNAAEKAFQQKRSRSAGSERLIIDALLSLRKEMQLLVSIMELPVIPQELRIQYVKLVQDQVDKIQASMEDSARKTDRSGKLSSILRNHPVNR